MASSAHHSAVHSRHSVCLVRKQRRVVRDHSLKVELLMKRFEIFASIAIVGLLLMPRSGEATIIDNFSQANSTDGSSWARNTGNAFSIGWDGLPGADTLGGSRELNVTKVPDGSVTLVTKINEGDAGQWEVDTQTGAPSNPSGLDSSTNTLQYDGTNDIGTASPGFDGPNGLNFDLTAAGETAVKLVFTEVYYDDLSYTITMTDGSGASHMVSGTAIEGATVVWKSINPIISAINADDIDDITLTFSTGQFANFTLDSIELVAGAIPEPSSLVLMATGILGLIGYGRRRRKEKAAS